MALTLEPQPVARILSSYFATFSIILSLFFSFMLITWRRSYVYAFYNLFNAFGSPFIAYCWRFYSCSRAFFLRRSKIVKSPSFSSYGDASDDSFSFSTCYRIWSLSSDVKVTKVSTILSASICSILENVVTKLLRVYTSTKIVRSSSLMWSTTTLISPSFLLI